MKKNNILIITVFCLSFIYGSNCFSQAVQEGNSIFDITYGWPANLFDDNYGGFGPVGIKYEYMVAEKVGVGGILNFAITDESIARLMAKFSFHFGNSESFDGYTTIATGFSSISYIAGRVALGGRYFFNEKTGVLMEFGIGGGGLIEFGLSFKL